MATPKKKAAQEFAPEKKYELLPDDTIQHFGRTLYRIRALVSFGAIAAGTLGGYVESESNLAQVSGDAWVSGDARVYGNAWVYGNALVSGDARVSGNAWVSGNALVSGDAQVYGNAWVSGNARVYGDAQVYGDARVYGNARVSGDASIIWVSKVGSESGTLTVTHGKDGLVVTRGCFTGSDVEFVAAVAERHGADSKIGREYALLIEFARLRLCKPVEV